MPNEKTDATDQAGLRDEIIVTVTSVPPTRDDADSD
jgi:hypothetical protein